MNAEKRPRARGRGWRAALGAIVLLVVILALSFGVRRSPTRPRPTKPLQRMDDGTVLTLEAVTNGKEHHYEPGLVPWSRLRALLPVLPQRSVFTESTQRDALVFWLSRREAATGQDRGFEWWASAAAFDEHGCRFADHMRRIQARGPHGNWGSTTIGPSALPAVPAEFTEIIGLGALEAFPRRGETFRLRLYDAAGRRAAELTVPNPTPGPHPAWTPEPLPITKRAGDLAFTLTALKRHEVRREGRGEAGRSVQIAPAYRITRGGRPTEEWEGLDATLSDATGNVSNLDPLNLCLFEPAWKLRVRFARTHRARFAPSEVWTVRGISVPPFGTPIRLTGTATRQGVTLQLLAIAGPGKFRYTRGVPEPRPLAAGERQRFRGHKILWGIGNDVQQDVEGGIPHVAVNATGLTEDHRLTLQATDDRGRRFFLAYEMSVGRARYLGLDLPPGAKRVALTLAVHTGRVVEFVVAPPPAEAG